jgi:hypothetical protein
MNPEEAFFLPDPPPPLWLAFLALPPAMAGLPVPSQASATTVAACTQLPPPPEKLQNVGLKKVSPKNIDNIFKNAATICKMLMKIT